MGGLCVAWLRVLKPICTGMRFRRSFPPTLFSSGKRVGMGGCRESTDRAYKVQILKLNEGRTVSCCLSLAFAVGGRSHMHGMTGFSQLPTHPPTLSPHEKERGEAWETVENPKTVHISPEVP